MGSPTYYLYDAEGTRMAKGTSGTLACYPGGATPATTYLIGPGGEQLTGLNVTLGSDPAITIRTSL